MSSSAGVGKVALDSLEQAQVGLFTALFAMEAGLAGRDDSPASSTPQREAASHAFARASGQSPAGPSVRYYDSWEPCSSAKEGIKDPPVWFSKGKIGSSMCSSNKKLSHD